MDTDPQIFTSAWLRGSLRNEAFDIIPRCAIIKRGSLSSKQGCYTTVCIFTIISSVLVTYAFVSLPFVCNIKVPLKHGNSRINRQKKKKNYFWLFTQTNEYFQSGHVTKERDCACSHFRRHDTCEFNLYCFERIFQLTRRTSA